MLLVLHFLELGIEVFDFVDKFLKVRFFSLMADLKIERKTTAPR